MTRILKDDILEVLLSEEQLKNRVEEIGKAITADYAG